MIDIIATVLRIVLIKSMEHSGVAPALIAAFWLIRAGWFASSRTGR